MTSEDCAAQPADTAALLREGIAAARAGQRQRAHDLLMNVVRQDENQPLAWLWLSGVVTSPEERKVCLENVLALDPHNTAAQKGLALLRQQEAPPSPPPTVIAEPVAPKPSPPPADPFADEYLCPFCTEPTEHADKRCPHCGEPLWVTFRRKEKRSTEMWIAIALQIFSTIRNAIIPFSIAALLYLISGDYASEFNALFGSYAEFSGIDMETLRLGLQIVLAISFIPLLFSLAVLVGLFARWKPVFYLLLAVSTLEVLFVGISVLGSALSQNPIYGLLGGGYLDAFLSIGAALWKAVLAFQIQDDFAFERRRIVLRVDPDVKSAPMLLSRGLKYADAKMWGMAALHLRNGVSMRPAAIDGRAALVLVYLKLKRFDLAEAALDEMRRIEPGNTQTTELQTLLDKQRATGPQSV
ncbi:MAG: hypothetical protein JXD18_01015 [Anaerolineae bacterium]|nr:hypothetical protein [Anaerolineae bacterium]